MIVSGWAAVLTGSLVRTIPQVRWIPKMGIEKKTPRLLLAGIGFCLAYTGAEEASAENGAKRYAGVHLVDLR